MAGAVAPGGGVVTASAEPVGGVAAGTAIDSGDGVVAIEPVAGAVAAVSAAVPSSAASLRWHADSDPTSSVATAAEVRMRSFI